MILLAFTVIFGIFFLLKIFTPVVTCTVFKMTIVKQKGTVSTIDTPTNVDFSRIYYVNTIDFPPGSVLWHPDIGSFGYSGDFFLFFNADMEVMKEGVYILTIASDDGFRLKLNGNLIGEWISNRSFASNQYRVILARGFYRIDLSYFQAYGPLGLTAEYRYLDGPDSYFFGRNSEYLHFKRN